MPVFPNIDIMRECRILTIIVVVLLAVISSEAKTLYDTERCNIQNLFSIKKSLYVIRYSHVFSDTLKVPCNCEIRFDGGGLCGPIVFNDTKLSGTVNLKGASIGGTVSNKVFDASWLCSMDGVTDEAKSINEMIEVCGDVFFPKGNYRLISKFNSAGNLPKEFYPSAQGHIAICKGNVTLKGEQGATFITDKPTVTLCVFSKPYDIEHSIGNIRLENIIFEVHNDGVNFHEFMHTIKMMGVNGITIKNCKFNDFWGDAICLSHFGDNPQTGERTRNQNVKILNNTIVGGDHHSNRNGISVINGKNVLIKDNTIRNTSRKDMPGGIDVEPNNSAYTIDNIRILDNFIEKIKTNAIQVYIPKGSPAHNIAIKRNTIQSSGNGIFIGIHSDNITDNFVISNNIIDSNTNPYRFVGNGLSNKWSICGNIFDRPCRQDIPGNIKVSGLVVKRNKKKV